MADRLRQQCGTDMGDYWISGSVKEILKWNDVFQEGKICECLKNHPPGGGCDKIRIASPGL